jgi:hypothetical protein
MDVALGPGAHPASPTRIGWKGSSIAVARCGTGVEKPHALHPARMCSRLVRLNPKQVRVNRLTKADAIGTGHGRRIRMIISNRLPEVLVPFAGLQRPEYA